MPHPHVSSRKNYARQSLRRMQELLPDLAGQILTAHHIVLESTLKLALESLEPKPRQPKEPQDG